jgi:hypothetical protein
MDAHRRKEVEVQRIVNLSGLHGHHAAPLRLGFGCKVVLLPAGDLASVAADAAVQDDQHPLPITVFHLFVPISPLALMRDDDKKSNPVCQGDFIGTAF